MVDTLEKTWLIDKKYLDCSEGKQGQWHKKSLPTPSQFTEFLSAHICHDISCTVSHCCFTEDYHSTIKYEEATTVLVFGADGISHFEFPKSGKKCIVRPGDIWLFNVIEGELLRTTPANVPSKMTVIKYATRRLRQAFAPQASDSNILANNTMQRLGLQQQSEQWIEALVTNKLVSINDRLLAEAKALELIAKWYTPNDTEVISNHPKLQPIIDRLMANLINPPSLTELASLALMSHARLNREFKKAFNMTVFDWLRKHRLTQAKAYLQDPTQSITNIALITGFSSASHFTQAFRNEYNITPSKYRHKHQEKIRN